MSQETDDATEGQYAADELYDQLADRWEAAKQAQPDVQQLLDHVCLYSQTDQLIQTGFLFLGGLIADGFDRIEASLFEQDEDEDDDEDESEEVE